MSLKSSVGLLQRRLDRGRVQLHFRHILLLVRNYTSQVKPERRETDGDQYGCRAANLDA